MAVPTGVPEAITSSLAVAKTGITEATSLLTSNWILFFGFSLAVLSIGVSFIRKLKRM